MFRQLFFALHVACAVQGVALAKRSHRCGSAARGASCLNSGYGNCCSQYNYCGSTNSFCSITAGCQSAYGSCTGSSTLFLTVSKNGRCGGTFSQTCQGSTFGNCCSQSGYCGSSSSYCRASCQSGYGTCSQPSSSPVASTRTSSSTPTSTQPVSKNARCGALFGGQTCKGSTYGTCCSQYSYCGSSGAYCGAASCQKGYGDCSVISSSSRTASSTRSSSTVQSSSSSSSTRPPPASSSSISSSSSSTTTSVSSSSALSTASSSAVSSTTSSSQLSPTQSSSSSVVPSSTTSSSSSITSSSVVISPSTTTTSTTSSSSASPVASPVQLVVNSDFELGTGTAATGWTITSSSGLADTANTGRYEGSAHSPTHSYRFQGILDEDGAGEYYAFTLSQTITIAPSSQYNVQVWARQDDGTLPCDITAAIYIGVNPRSVFSSKRPGTDYTLLSGTYTTTANPLLTQTLSIGISCYNSGDGEDIYIDDVTVTLVV